jgi:hypothetical protein
MQCSLALQGETSGPFEKTYSPVVTPAAIVSSLFAIIIISYFAAIVSSLFAIIITTPAVYHLAIFPQGLIFLFLFI